MIVTGTIMAAGAGVAVGYQSIVNGTPVAQTLSNVASTARQGVASAVGVVAPTYRNTGNRATPAQIEAWCRKVGRRQGAQGIREVPRVRTSAYVDAAFPLDLRGFARKAGEGTGTGLKGGTILAVLCSVETGAGISPTAAFWNYNAGNFKLYREQWHADVTPPCYFLVDRHPSLDFYPSFDTLEAGIAAWARATFANDRYNRFGTMDALRNGDLRAFCRGIGLGGYARMYRYDSIGRETFRGMDARFRRLAGLGRYSRNRAVIDGSQVMLNDSIR